MSAASLTARARAAAALFALTAALAVSGEVATAAPTATAHAAHRTRTKSRAHTRANLHARLRAHARLHARSHAAHRSRLHALTTVAAADASAAEASAGGASLRGSHAAVDRAYDEAVREGLPFVHSYTELERRAGDGEYVPLSRATSTYQLKGVGSPYVRPATRDFVTSFAADYARTCGEPLTVTSAMRPTSIRLRNSVEKSVHPTGMAVDLRASRTGCRAWMRTTLLGLERQGVIDATEEHHPAHFHVVVLRAP
ncbi:hypothetical protein tb265_22810 [Gemmatimonadetes bacterium T265]|nr:hypothetical protein tb265_22810 [Gemmatimonadetes bacterium T265]